jgi:protein TonB
MTISLRRERAKWTYSGAVLSSKRKFRLAQGGDGNGCRLHTLASGLFVVFLFLAPVVAQEPGGKPDAPAPKVGQVAIPSQTKLTAIPLAAKSGPKPDIPRSLQELAIEILKYVSAPSCKKAECAILVTDFVLPDGNTSPYGMRLADELSEELASRGNKIHVVDRGLLHNILMAARVPAKSIDEQLARSIALELKATFVVLGTTTKSADDVVQLSTLLLDAANVTDKDWSGNGAKTNFVAPKSVADLSPLEPFSLLPPITTSASGENVYLAEVDGVSSPKCYYMPNPPFSEGARKSKLNGTVSVEAVINSEGRLEQERIIRGLPDGLNETTIATMKTWKCNPALKDGKPVPTLVKFDVSFRLY